MIILVLFLGSLIWSLAPPSSIQGEFQMCSEQEEGSSRYFFSQEINQENFYRNAIRHFLEPATEEEFQKRVREWMVEFDIPKTLNHQLTPNWYTGDKIRTLEDILLDWEKEYGIRPNFKIDEKLARGIVAVTFHIGNSLSSSKGKLSKNSLPWSEQHLKYFLSSKSESECRSRIDEKMKQYEVPQKVLEEAEQQKDVFLEQTVSSLHKEWQEIIGDYKFPSYITPRQTHVLENIIMFAKLRWSSFNMEELKMEVKRRKEECGSRGLPKIKELSEKVKEVFAEGRFIVKSQEKWVNDKVFFMTERQMEDLKSNCQLEEEKKEIKRIYDESLFSLLRKFAKRGGTTEQEEKKRLQFIEELEVYLVEAYQDGDEEALSRLKISREFTMVNIGYFRKNKEYTDSVRMFRSQAKDIEWILKDLSNKKTSWRTDNEIKVFWRNVLDQNAGICPAGSISRPLHYIQEMYSWHKLSDPQDMFYVLWMKLYRDLVEQIAGEMLVKVRHRYRVEEVYEAHMIARVYNVLSRSQVQFLAQYDQVEDRFERYVAKGSHPEIEHLFMKSFNPFCLGVQIFELLQDPRCGNMCANLTGVGLQKELFMDNTLSSIRLDHFVRFIGRKYIVFDSPEEIVRRRWINLIKTHRFSELGSIIRGKKQEDIARFWQAKIGDESCLSIFLRNASQEEMEQLKWQEIAKFEVSKNRYEVICVEAFCRRDRVIIEWLEQHVDSSIIQERLKANQVHALKSCLKEGSLSNLKELRDKVGFRCLLVGYRGSEYSEVFKLCVEDFKEGFQKIEFLFAEKILDVGRLQLEIEDKWDSLLTYVMSIIEETVKERKKGFLIEEVSSDQVEEILIEYMNYFTGIYSKDESVEKWGKVSIPIDYICSRGYFKVLRFLMERESNIPNMRYRRYRSLLSIAARDGHLEIAKYLEDREAKLALETRRQGLTWMNLPLLQACRRDRLEIVKWFLEVLRKKKPNLDLRPYVQKAIEEKAMQVTRYLLVYIGVEATKGIYQGLIANRWIGILAKVDEIRTLRGFIKSGGNPWKEPHRVKQIGKCIQNGELDSDLIVGLCVWKEGILAFKKSLDEEDLHSESRVVLNFRKDFSREISKCELVQNIRERLEWYGRCCKSA